MSILLQAGLDGSLHLSRCSKPAGWVASVELEAHEDVVVSERLESLGIDTWAEGEDTCVHNGGGVTLSLLSEYAPSTGTWPEPA